MEYDRSSPLKNQHSLFMTIVRGNSDSDAANSFLITQAFCWLMLQTSLIAIPSYLGLFMIAVPFDVNSGVERGLILSTPAIEFVAASVIYSIGIFIVPPDGDRENFENKSYTKNRAVHRKVKFILLGSIPLLFGILSGTILLLKAHL